MPTIATDPASASAGASVKRRSQDVPDTRDAKRPIQVGSIPPRDAGSASELLDGPAENLYDNVACTD
jgi:hypothetical protein